MRRQRARVEALNAEIARQRQDSSNSMIRQTNSRDNLDDVLEEADRIVGPEYHQQQER